MKLGSRSVPWQARSVASGDVQIATRDWLAAGPDLVLLHGAGPDQRSMARLAAVLTPYFHVVTYDQRGCGASTDGPWTFATALDDLHAVIDGYRLVDPIVVGHSLGGMIAVLYGGKHPDARAVVNIDGWGPGKPEQYLGEDPASVLGFQDRLIRLESPTALGRALYLLLRVIPAARRNRGMLVQALAAIRELDVLELHHEAKCPVLAINCTAPVRGAMKRLIGAQGARLLDSYQRGLALDLSRLVHAHPNVRVVELAATHNVIATGPHMVADQIRSFTTPPTCQTRARSQSGR